MGWKGLAFGELRVSPPQTAVRGLHGAEQLSLQAIGGLLVELLVRLGQSRHGERELIGGHGHVV